MYWTTKILYIYIHILIFKLHILFKNNCTKHNFLRLSEEIFYKDILEENVFQYFHGGGLVQQLYKDKRRAERNSAREQFFSKQPGIFHHLIFLFTLGLMKSFDLFPFYVIVFTLLINWLLDFIDWLIDWLSYWFYLPNW